MTTIYYLYLKTHKKTGLKYLGQTTRDPYEYCGSGIWWTRHLNTNGYNIETVILQKCYTKSALKSWGLYYSKLWSVVDSNKWANLKDEDGVGGATYGMKGKSHTNDAKIKISVGNLGKVRTKETRAKMIANHVGHSGKKHSTATKAAISKIHTSKPKSEITKQNMRLGSKSKKTIHTPAGIFDSIREAAEKMVLCRDTIRARLKSQIPGYYYL